MNQQPYYEIWSCLESQAKWLRIMLLASILLIIALVSLCYSMLMRPIAVVNLDANGEAKVQLKEPSLEKPSDDEATSFAKEFLALYLAPDSVNAEHNFKRAATMMTSSLKERHLEFLKKANYMERLRGLGVSAALTFKRTLVRRQKENVVDVYAWGTQQTNSQQGMSVFNAFEGVVRLHQIERTRQNPYGLEVVDLNFELKPNQ